MDQGCIPLAKEKMSSWDHLWKEVNDEFEKGLKDNTNWKDLSGKMFICWDGNHRLHGWKKEIHENFMHDKQMHICVLATFIAPT
eukprot:c10354_g1_i1 orf=113-364(+)